MKKILVLLLILSFFAYIPAFLQAQEPNTHPRNIFAKLDTSALSKDSNKVYVIPVEGAIDLGLAAFIKRCLQEAKQENVICVILEINTFGGRVDAAIEICDYLQDIKPITTVAFIDNQAWSAGALISLACERIIISPGSSIGSAEPRTMGLPTVGKDEFTDEKAISAVSAKFKAVAELNDYPVNLALAMVDKDYRINQIRIKNTQEVKIVTAQQLEELEEEFGKKNIQLIKTISPEDKLLNLTAAEAKEFGLSDETLKNRREVIKYLGLGEKEIILGQASWSEILVRFLTHPMISPLLLAFGFLGILFELKIPGWGISGTIGLLCLSLFFWGHYLVGLANWTELIIFFLGILLLLLEILVIPGFGIAGISGIILVLSGIFLSFVKNPLSATSSQLNQAFYSFSFTIIVTFLGIIIAWRYLPHTSLWKRLILNFSETRKQGFDSSASAQSFLGKTGESLTQLRPSGRVMVGGKTLDVITEGEFIEKDKPIKVIKVEGNKITVKEV